MHLDQIVVPTRHQVVDGTEAGQALHQRSNLLVVVTQRRAKSASKDAHEERNANLRQVEAVLGGHIIAIVEPSPHGPGWDASTELLAKEFVGRDFEPLKPGFL